MKHRVLLTLEFLAFMVMGASLMAVVMATEPPTRALFAVVISVMLIMSARINQERQQ